MIACKKFQNRMRKRSKKRREQGEIYQTWQEAGEAAQSLGISTLVEYKKRRGEDPCLPPDPYNSYKGFPGWCEFLGKEKPAVKYDTWEKARKATQVLCISTLTEYKKRYKEDPHLPSCLYSHYKSFPSARVFFGKEKFTTVCNAWQDAGRIANELGINSPEEYRERYTENRHLIPNPESYEYFPGWNIFLENTGEPS